MSRHFLIPGVQHGQEAEFGAQSAWISANGEQRF
jgi:hypothetical protein